MFGLGMPEVILILVIALVVYGPAKLPEMGASFGKAIREFRNGLQEAPPEKRAEKALPDDKERKEQGQG